jgi:hypothetical protein
VSMVRVPGRFAIVAVLGLSLLFGFALQAILRHASTWTRPARLALAGALAALLAIELTPVPRRLYSAAVPDVYRMIAASGEESGTLLELPTGIRDGTSSVGDFSAGTQFFQTRHRRPVIGGYLSRVSKSRKDRMHRDPMMRALFTLSEGAPLTEDLRQDAARSRDAFLRHACMEFVVVDRARAPDGLETFAVEALRLDQVFTDDGHSVYRPRNPPPCDRSPDGKRQRRGW